MYRFYARMSSAVLVKILLSVLGAWVGKKADTHFGTEPYLMFLGFVMGVSVGLWWVIYNANRPSE